jgi:hypothetical protein
MTSDTHVVLRRIRCLLLFFTAGLILSGLTAFPIKTEVAILNAHFGEGSSFENTWPAMARWISRVHAGVTDAHQKHRFLFYGTDWLAFAHIVIAIAFIGPIRDPVRNVWVVEFGMIACVLVVPLALIWGGFRGIPLFWRVIDCSFGVVGIVPLWLSRHYIRALARETAPS